jgi:hypothetical protein
MAYTQSTISFKYKPFLISTLSPIDQLAYFHHRSQEKEKEERNATPH